MPHGSFFMQTMAQVFNPLITLSHSSASSTVNQYKQAFDSLELPASSRVSYIAMIGRRCKSDALQHLLRGTDFGLLADTHGQICLWKDPSGPEASPTVYIDVEAHHADAGLRKPQPGFGHETSRTINWFDGPLGPWTRRRVGLLLASRVISPLSEVVCYFAADLGGVRGVAAMLVEQIIDSVVLDVTPDVLPRVLVIVESTSSNFDCHAAESRLMNNILDLLRSGDADRDDHKNRQKFLSHFKSISVFGRVSVDSIRQQRAKFRRQLLSIKRESARARLRINFCFTRDHSYAFIGKLLDHFCRKRSSSFSFVKASRPFGFCRNDLAVHIKELFTIIPAETWLWHLACPLLATAIMYTNYPPGSHSFPVAEIFQPLRSVYSRAVNESFLQPVVRKAFMDILETHLESLSIDLTLKQVPDARTLHLRELARLRPFLSKMKTYRTCLSCLMRAPEKVLECGHAYCDECISALGTRSLDDKYSYQMSACAMCGEAHNGPAFRMVPPTAGIRTLSLDGGGVRGIIPLVFLTKLEISLGKFRVPISEYFDFVCGTSAGGLIVLGLFLMRWSTRECQSKFEELAMRTFKQRPCSTLLSRIQEYTFSYLRDCQYSSSPIEAAFQSTFGDAVQMFNPLSNATRVAVTTTTAKDTQTCLFSNYNGTRRPALAGYSILRAPRAKHEASLGEAASSTSAAPWFFKPKWIEHLGTFQDGALQHNNPLMLALWEIRHLWPGKSVPDFALSIGTGAVGSEGTANTLFAPSPVRDRFLPRVFRTFMRSMDGEKAWHELYNSLPDGSRSRLYRVNLTLKGSKEPQLDDLASMHALRSQALIELGQPSCMKPILDAIYASTFYFEFESIPTWTPKGYLCHGHIFCRLLLPAQGRTMLCQDLITSKSYFLVFGQPFVCVDGKMRQNSLFKRRVHFPLSSLSEPVRITIRGITSEPKTISGLPKPAEELLHAQGLYETFGRADHLTDKCLPSLPVKRKFSQLGT